MKRFLLTILFINKAVAQIVADPQAPDNHQPQILLSSEQVPQVDIQAPSPAGVSMNEYQQFDVGREGAIINNSRKGAATHSGGWVSGNPNLIRGEASVIVNQVNSSAPSQLQGSVEVAGQRADLIMANPAGINVNGGRFINAGKTWLSTGKPEFRDGKFDGVSVEQGAIAIGRDGLDVRDSDYTALIARSVRQDGPVRAGDGQLDVIVGTNKVSAAGRISPSKSNGSAAAKAPEVALDSSKLGGMYAGGIRLISTEAGVGVNHGGNLQAQRLELSVDGRLSNSGAINADNLHIDAKSLENSGEIMQGAGTLTVKAASMENSGAVQRAMVAKSGKVSSSEASSSEASGKAAPAPSPGSIKVSGNIKNRGQIGSGGEVNLQLQRNLHNDGKIAVGQLQVSSGSSRNNGSISADKAEFSGENLTNSGKLQAQELTVHSRRLDNGGSISAPKMQLSGESLNNRGAIQTDSQLSISTNSWQNSGVVGRGGSSGGVGNSSSSTGNGDNSSINYRQINNSGSISAAGGVDLSVNGEFRNSGSMDLNGLSFRGHTLDNRGGEIHSQRADIDAHTLDNENGVFAAEHFDRFKLSGRLNNKNGTFYSGDDLKFSVPQFDNPVGSSLGSGRTLSVKSDSINNGGRLFARNVLEMQAQRLSNQGQLQGGSLNFQVDQLENRGTIEQTGGGRLKLSANTLNNHEKGIIGKPPEKAAKVVESSSNASPSGTNTDGQLKIGTLDNHGTISAAGSLELSNTPMLNNRGHIHVDQLNASSFANHGYLRAANAQLEGKSLKNYGTLIGDKFQRFHYDQVENHGTLLSATDFRLDSKQLHNAGNLGSATKLDMVGNIHNEGRIQAPRLEISGDGKLSNFGTVQGDESLVLGQKYTENRGQISAGQLHLRGEKVENHGQLWSQTAFKVDLPQLANRGEIFSGGSFSGQLKQLDNSGSIAAQRFQLQSERLHNQGEIQQLGGGLTIEVDRLHNYEGAQLGERRAAASGSGNAGATATSAESGTLRVGNLENRGSLAVAGAVKLLSRTSLHNDGQLWLSQLEAQGERFSGAGKTYAEEAKLSALQTDFRGEFSGRRLDFAREHFTNHAVLRFDQINWERLKTLENQGDIETKGALKLQLERFYNGGRFGVGDRFDFQGQEFSNSGRFFSLGDQDLQARHINNSGLLASNGSQRLRADQLEQRGEINSHSLDWSARQINNDGSVFLADNLELWAPRFENQGLIGASEKQQTNQTANLVGGGNSSAGAAAASRMVATEKFTQGSKGAILSNGKVVLKTSGLDNSGQLRLQDLSADGEHFNNRGSIDTERAQITATNMNNGGLLLADALTLQTKRLNNSGTVASANGYQIDATDEIQNSGQLLSAKDLTLNSPRLRSSGGRISAQELTLNLPQGLENAGQILARVLRLNTPTLRNDGQIYGEQDYQIKVNGLENRGSLSSPGNLSVQVQGRAVNDGSILANHMDFKAQSLSGSGTVSGAEMANVELDQLDGAQNISAGEQLQLTVQRAINNSGIIGAGKVALIRAAGIYNGGRLLAGQQLQVETGTLDNEGLLNSSGLTSVQASSIDNRGRIYGDQVDLKTGTLNNSGSAVIAGREALQINANEINNRRLDKNGPAPLLKSDGSMVLSGGTLNNDGGVVQSAGTMVLDGLRVFNRNPFYQSKQVLELIKRNEQYIISRDENAPNRDMHERRKFNDHLRHFTPYNPAEVGGLTSVNHMQEITADVYKEDSKTVSSTPGQILAGGDLVLNQTHITNDKSWVIAGGAIQKNGGHIENIGAERRKRNVYEGTYKNTRDRRRKFIGHVRVEDGPNAKGIFKKEDDYTVSNDGEVREEQFSSPDLLAQNSNESSSVNVSAGPNERVESGDFVTINYVPQLNLNGQLFQPAAANSPTLIQTDPDYIGGVVAQLTPISAPKTVAAQVNENPANRIASRLANIEAALSGLQPLSAGLGVSFDVDHTKLAALAPYTPPGWDGKDLHKRLGDGYQELDSVMKQLNLQTGRLQLPGSGSQLERFKDLVNRGVEVSKRFNLAPGIALSKEQMRQLTGDVVLFVKRNVQMADGSTQSVLVPQLYSRKRAGDVDGRRAHISGEHLAGSGGSVNNRSMLNARESNTLKLDRFSNRGGTTKARDMQLYSEEPIDNSGGEILGRRVLDVESGGDIINGVTQNKGEKARIGTIGVDGNGSDEDNSGGYMRVYAGGVLRPGSGSFYNRNANSFTLLSGKEVVFDPSQQEQKFLSQGGGASRLGAPARHYLREDSLSDIFSNIETNESDVLVEAREGKITGRAVAVDSKGGQVTFLGRDGVDLKAGKKSYEREYSDHNYSHGLLSSKEMETYRHKQGNAALPNSITGKKVQIIAGYDQNGNLVNGAADIKLSGTQVVSDNGTLLQAGKDIWLAAAGENYQLVNKDYQRKNGLQYSFRQPLTAFVGKQQMEGAGSQQGENLVPTVIGALDGNITIRAGNHFQSDYSIVHAGRKANLGPVKSKEELDAMSPAELETYWKERSYAGNVDIEAKSMTVNALTTGHSSQQQQKSKQSGLSIGLSGGALDSLNAARSNLDSLLKSENSRIKALGTGLAAFNVHQAMERLPNLKKDLRVGFNLGTSRSSSESQSYWENVHPSQISGDGTVHVKLRGTAPDQRSLTVIGSDLGGADRTILDVEGQKYFGAIETNSYTNSRQRSSSNGFGFSLGTNLVPGLDLGVGRGGGYYHNENKELRLSHIGDARGHTYLNANSPDIGAGGKTTIAGAQLFGRSVNGLTQDLTIISPQERGREQGKSWHWNVSSDPLAVAGSLAGGYGKIQGNYASVNGQSGLRDTPAAGRLDESLQQHNAAYNAEHGWRSGQSGIFAGDDGFNIENQGELQLGGGIITSTQTAEDKGNNRLVTDTIKVWDVKNHSNSSGVAVSGQLSASYGNDGLQLGRSLGPAGRRQNASDTSYGAVGTRNIIVRDDAGQQALTGESGAEAANKAFKPIWSDSNGGATGSNFQGQKGLASLQAEANITQQASAVGQQFQQKWDGEAEQLRQRYENGEMSATAYKTGLDEINRKKTLMDSAIGALSAPGGTSSVVVGAMSPTVAQTIKANTTPGSLSNALAHGAWGATQMLANGGNGSDALRGALTTGGTELLAPALAQNLYGTSDPQKLTPNQKNNLKVLTGTTAGLIGASNGNPLMGTTAVQAADNALNHNFYLTPEDIFKAEKVIDAENYTVTIGGVVLREKEATPEEKNKKIKERFDENTIELLTECDVNKSLIDCGEQNQHAIDFVNSDYSKSKELEPLRRITLLYLHNNWEAVDKSIKAKNNRIKYRYVLPVVGMGEAILQAVGSYAAAEAACVGTAGTGCWTAVSLASASITSAGSKLSKDWHNLGLSKDKQIEKDAIQLELERGFSEEQAAFIRNVVDLGSGYALEILAANNLRRVGALYGGKGLALTNTRLPTKESLFRELELGKKQNIAVTTEKYAIAQQKLTNQGTTLKNIDCSFHGDMEVRTDKGFLPIKNIKIGDRVLAHNEVSGESRYQSVLNTINSIDQDTVYLTIKDYKDQKQIIISDSRHPYFTLYGNDQNPPPPSMGKNYKGNITNAYWIDAGKLKPGYKLLDDSGLWQTITEINVEQQPLNSYNLEVNQDHNFFIRGVGGKKGVLVHNKNCWGLLPPNAKKTNIKGNEVYEFEDNGKKIRVIENPQWQKNSSNNGPKYIEVKIRQDGTVNHIAENTPNVVRNYGSNVIIAEQGSKTTRWNKDLNKPLAKQKYETDKGYLYETDANRRTIRVEGELRLKQNDRSGYQQACAGGNCRLSSDHGGHLIASQFEGPGEAINIVAMDRTLNGSSGEWYKMEQEWANALKEGKKVEVKIEVFYKNSKDKRPSEFKISYTIDGGDEPIKKSFKNTATGN